MIDNKQISSIRSLSGSVACWLTTKKVYVYVVFILSQSCHKIAFRQAPVFQSGLRILYLQLLSFMLKFYRLILKLLRNCTAVLHMKYICCTGFLKGVFKSMSVICICTVLQLLNVSRTLFINIFYLFIFF